jgi:hypothetical protein
MKIDGEVEFDPRKLTDYLLVWQPKSDKSKFLNRLGYFQENWEELRADILNIMTVGSPVYSRPAPFGGDLYKIVGELRNFGVVTIWLHTEESATWRFVTLYPDDL